MKKTISALLLSVFSSNAFALSVMSESDMAKVSGQGLIVSDTITGSGLSAGFDFIRMGLDARLSLNANIDKLQLGCGGFNNVVQTGCDIDFDFVRLMGRNGVQPGAVGSDFVLTRPYIEIATKGTGTTREVAGVKIGSQSANGYMGVGRTYTSGQTNLENGGTCGSADGDPALACHSGINSISGYLRAEMSAQVDVNVIGIFNETACFGNTSYTNDSCGASDAYYRDLIGTRMRDIRAPSIPLKLSGGFLSAIGINQAYADLTENFRFIHGFALVDTDDFGLSFQRERIAWPTYDRTGYSYPTNVGWWLNVPDVKALDIRKQDTVNIGLGEIGSALGKPGLPLTNIELDYTPPDNCYGTTSFC